jgi:hypothetical protein
LSWNNTTFIYRAFLYLLAVQQDAGSSRSKGKLKKKEMEEVSPKQPRPRVLRGINALTQEHKATLTEMAFELNQKIRNTIPSDRDVWEPDHKAWGYQEKVDPYLLEEELRTMTLPPFVARPVDTLRGYSFGKKLYVSQVSFLPRTLNNYTEFTCTDYTCIFQDQVSMNLIWDPEEDGNPAMPDNAVPVRIVNKCVTMEDSLHKKAREAVLEAVEELAKGNNPGQSEAEVHIDKVKASFRVAAECFRKGLWPAKFAFSMGKEKTQKRKFHTQRFKVMECKKTNFYVPMPLN